MSFPHAATAAAVCASCRSSVVRTDGGVAAIGKVSAMLRALSPVQVDTRGNFEGRSFRVLGVVRRGRERVRWNEWFLAFDDGATGWLGESNGRTWMFPTAPVALDEGQLPGEVGGTFDVAGTTYRVAERAEAQVVAAEGALPGGVVDGQARAYADLQQVGGARVATVELVGAGGVGWFGRQVDLAELRLEGCRAFGGWSDPAILSFAGPELTDIATAQCANCGASVPVRAPGATVHVACAYCGSITGVDLEREGKPLLAGDPMEPWTPRLPLGSKGTLRGEAWQAIGAMVRSVREEGIEYPWTEYLLFNPYRGFAWLIDAQGHWTLGRLLGESPSLRAGRRDALPTVRGTSYRPFQRGEATVKRVLGEFTWEVHVGDRAMTWDFVEPPRILSRETADQEETWTLGEYVPAAEVGRAFAFEPRRPEGTAPHQPNPWSTPEQWAGALRMAAVLVLAAVVLALGGVALADDEVVAKQSWLTRTGTDTFVAEAGLQVPDQLDRRVRVDVRSDVAQDFYARRALVTLVNTATGALYEAPAALSDGDAPILLYPDPGTYDVRVQLFARDGMPSWGAHSVGLTAVRDPPRILGALLLFLYALAGPVGLLFMRGAFESARWENSNWGRS